MRNILVGFAVVGLLAVGVGAPAVAHTMSAPMAVVRPNADQRADSGGADQPDAGRDDDK